MRRVQQPGKDYRGTQSTHTNRSQQLGTLARTEMSSSLWLHRHKGKGAIHPMVCVERQRWAWGLRTALHVLGPSETQEMPLGFLVVFHSQKAKVAAWTPEEASTQ